MKQINIKKDLRRWLIEYITDTIHGIEAEDFDEFNKWAKSFEKEEAEFVVDMEFGNDWGYDVRETVSEEEAMKYAQTLLQDIIDNWYL